MDDLGALDVEMPLVPRRGVVGRGRTSSTGTEITRELGGSDIASLADRRPTPPAAPLAKIRDVHHWAARYIAEGKRDVEVSALTGYTPEYIRILKGDPAFKELVGFYRKNQEAAYADLHERLKTLGIQATAELLERLATTPEKMTDETILAIAKMAADRTGHGPAAKQVNVNIHGGMAERLAAARQRVERAKPATEVGLDRSAEDAQVIEGRALPAPGRTTEEGPR